jgi:tetratricopeptide (TPR) repeat protein
MIRPGKRFVFTVVTGVIPIVVLVILELALQIVGAFERLPVVYDVPNKLGTLRGFNALVAGRYVDPRRTAVPMLTPETFRTVKTPDVLRVLCLGGSTTAGFPFDCQVPYPAQLRQRLSEAYPRKHVEVLNAGIAAISSYVVLDMLPELLETKPDVVVVYMGHNEFYGIYGSGSALVEGGSDLIVRASLAAQRTRIGRMIKRCVEFLAGSPKTGSAARTLMQEAVKDQVIPFGSLKYRTTIENFHRNLDRLLSRCADDGIPVIISSLVSNERDLPPFRPIVDSTRIRPVDARTLFAKGDSLCALRRWDDAATLFGDLLRADSGNADTWYRMGKCALALSQPDRARAWFVGARDRDAMRFRASGDANAAILSAARKWNALLVDLDSLFAERSPDRIIGSELICDHLHPNPLGYALMAEAFCSAIESLRVVSDSPVTGRNDATPRGVTDLDWEIGLLKVFPIMHAWPFRIEFGSGAEYRPFGDTAANRVAYEYLDARIPWSSAHQLMAQEYLRRGDEASARKEYEAVAVFEPDDQWPWRMIAESYKRESRWDLRAAALEECLRRPGPRGMPAYELALTFMELKNLRGAIDAMSTAVQAPEFTSEQRKNAMFYLAGFLSDAGKTQEAVDILRALLREDPRYGPAQKFLGQLLGRGR